MMGILSKYDDSELQKKEKEAVEREIVENCLKSMEENGMLDTVPEDIRRAYLNRES